MNRSWIAWVVAAAALGVAVAWLRGPSRNESRTGNQPPPHRDERVAGDSESGRGEASDGRARVVPPQIRLAARSPVEERPGAPGYDPILIADVLERRSVDIFAEEPRDARWASEMESRLSSAATRDIQAEFPDARVDRVECRTAACEIEITVPDSDGDRAYRFVQGFVPLGAMIEPELGEPDDAGRRAIIIHALYSPDVRDPGAFFRLYDEFRAARKQAIEQFRAREADAPEEPPS